uniref:Uncharacterized protein n=1 Tax=Tetranychus urticae TaxID=32264 RepID=T1K6Q0_TETUR
MSKKNGLIFGLMLTPSKTFLHYLIVMRWPFWRIKKI